MFKPEKINLKKIESEFLKKNGRESLIRKKRHLTLIYLDIVNNMKEGDHPRATGNNIFFLIFSSWNLGNNQKKGYLWHPMETFSQPISKGP